MFDPVQPFVLLDDVAAGTARLFTGLQTVVEALVPAAVAPALERLQAPGPWAGFVGFEAGYALEPRLAGRATLPPAGEPLLWFGRFAREEAVVAAALLGAGPASIGAAVPGLARSDHAARLARVQALIAAGDIYQANLTFNAMVAVGGHPLHLYARLRAGSRAPYGALLFTGGLWVLSFSPELFFRMDGRQLIARPMKGTAPRGGDIAEDRARAAALQTDPKNRAENLMITDLLRNDLSRVGENVAVPALFEIETYPTVLQMTSTITATARPGITAADVLARLFPCGSVTGAPKIRAMEVIADVEAAPRGVYTGSIGAIAASGDAVFNVAIRTLVMAPEALVMAPEALVLAPEALAMAPEALAMAPEALAMAPEALVMAPGALVMAPGALAMAPGAQTARLGLGSGIVADSEASAEWAECLQKSAFLGRRGVPDLIETMRLEGGIVCDLPLHLARMAASARFLGGIFDEKRAETLVESAIIGVDRARVRLVSAPSGALSVQVSALPLAPDGPVTVALVPLPVASDDWRLRHKTSDRAFYDDARLSAGVFEVVLVHEGGQVTEGSFTNVFVERGAVLLTPPCALGLLPGVLRARLLAEGRAVEAPLAPADLAGGFFIGNAVRGLLPARLA